MYSHVNAKELPVIILMGFWLGLGEWMVGWVDNIYTHVEQDRRIKLRPATYLPS